MANDTYPQASKLNSVMVPPTPLTCKDNGHCIDFLTIGRRYIAFAESEEHYLIRHDKGGIGAFEKTRFTKGDLNENNESGSADSNP